MVEILDFELAKARLRVKRAERSIEPRGVSVRPFAAGSDPSSGWLMKPNSA